MARLRYLLSNINVVNVLLAVVLLVVAYFTFLHTPPVKMVKVKQAVKKAALGQGQAGAKEAAQYDKTPFPTDYAVIADENLFRPDRKIPPKKVEKKPGPPQPKPEFVLDGIIATDNMQIAFMQDKKKPVSTPGRPDRQTPLRIGDSLSGYTLVDIDKDKVVMRKGSDKIEVNLTDPSKVRHYASTGSAAAAPRTPAVRPGNNRRVPARNPVRRAATRRNEGPRHNMSVRIRRDERRGFPGVRR